jgi:hypothetical protein
LKAGHVPRKLSAFMRGAWCVFGFGRSVGDFGLRTLDSGLRNQDFGLRTPALRLKTLDYSTAVFCGLAFILSKPRAHLMPPRICFW